MILKKITIENLRSYEKQEIVFPKGSILLSGDIGAGKTTILLAIEFALFGIQPSQKGSSLLRNGENNGRVILELDIEGKNIIIERALKRSKKSVSQEYVSMIIDDEKFEESVGEIKSRVLKLLNYPFEFSKKTNLLYKFTVYTPQEEMKQIIIEPKDIRLNTLRHVFGIDKYKKIEENIFILASKLRENIRINEGRLYNFDRDMEILKEKQEHLIRLKTEQEKADINYKQSAELKKEKENLLKDVQNKIEEKRVLENEKSKSEILASEKKQQLKTLDRSLENLIFQIQEAKKIIFDEQVFESLNQRIKHHEIRKEELQKEYIGFASEINSQESKKKETNELKKKIFNLQKCPTCLQEVSDAYKKNIFSKAESEIKLSQKKIEELILKKKKVEEEMNNTNKIIDEFKKTKSEMDLLRIKLENVREKEQGVSEIERQKQLVEKDLEILEKHLKTIESSIAEYSRYDEIFKQRSCELEEAKMNENNCIVKQAEIKKEIQFSEKDISDRKESVEEKKKIRSQTEQLREIEYWISNKFLELVLFTEKQVMFTLKEEFSKIFSKWFAILVSDDLSAKLDENFSPVIEQQDYEIDYSFLSGGERTAIALAYRLALNQVINSILSRIKTRNLVILDEPTDGFSEQQLDKVRDILTQLDTEQLIIVSHEQKIESFVDNIIRLKKDGGVTRIEG